MSGLDQRPDKQVKKQAHVQERVQSRDAVVTSVRAPLRPQTPRPPEAQQPEVQTSADKVGAVLMALAGKAPRTMPETLTWSKSGAVTVLPESTGRRAVSSEALRAQVERQRTGRAGEVLRSLSGQSVHVTATHNAEATWTALVAAVQAGHSVVAGGGDDEPTERHERTRVALVTGVDAAAEPRAVTLLGADGEAETMDLTEFCATFAAIAVAESP